MPNSTSCGRTKSTLFSSKLNENFFEILNSKFIPGEGRGKTERSATEKTIEKRLIDIVYLYFISKSPSQASEINPNIKIRSIIYYS
jgi:hypothetical protein